jgi:hypothetical protein
MVENNGDEDRPELLFFDTFSHINEDLQDVIIIEPLWFL